MKELGNIRVIWVVAFSVFFTGCVTSYHQYMSQDERIEARYREQVEGRIFKRAFIDIITLGFSEIWYHKATSSYRGVLAKREAEAVAEREWQEWRKAQIGKTRAEIVSVLGCPDRDDPDGCGGRMLTWENSNLKGVGFLRGSSYSSGYLWSQSASYGNFSANGSYIAKSEWESTIRTTRLWVVVNGAGKVVSVGRRTKETAVLPNR